MSKKQYAAVIFLSVFSGVGFAAFIKLLAIAFFPFLDKFVVLFGVSFMILPFWLVHDIGKEMRAERSAIERINNSIHENTRKEEDAILQHYPLLDPSNNSIRSRDDLDKYFESHAYEYAIFS